MRKILPPGPGILSPDRPARSESLIDYAFPAHNRLVLYGDIIGVCCVYSAKHINPGSKMQIFLLLQQMVYKLLSVGLNCLLWNVYSRRFFFCSTLSPFAPICRVPEHYISLKVVLTVSYCIVWFRRKRSWHLFITCPLRFCVGLLWLLYVVRYFRQSNQGNLATLPKIRSQPLPRTNFPIHSLIVLAVNLLSPWDCR